MVSQAICISVHVAAEKVQHFLRNLTISFNVLLLRLNHPAESWPLRQILEIEADMIGLRQWIEIATIEVEQIQSGHLSD